MKFVFYLFLFYHTFLFSQSIEIPASVFPYSDVIEWKGMGAILVDKDQTGTTSKTNLTLVSSQATPIWKESYYPSGKESFYITSENARYIYFLDNILLNNGKCSYSQINPAGNIKSATIDIYYQLKKIRPFEMSDINLVDIVTTEKALVFIFRYVDKKDKKVIDYAFSMTHNNLTTYVGIIGETPELAIKDKLTNGWKYIGYSGDQIFFATRDEVNKKKGFTVKAFTPRIEGQTALFIPMLDNTTELLVNTDFGATGKNYIKHDNDIENSILINFNSKFYLTTISAEGSNRNLKNYVFVEGKWELMHANFTLPASKDPLKLGVQALNQGLAVKVENAGKSQVVLVPFAKEQSLLVTDYQASMLFDPSRFTTSEHKGAFVSLLPTRTLFFERNQLNKTGVVKFEYIGK